MTFPKRYERFVALLREHSVIPEAQIAELEYRPKLNPPLSPHPQDWWRESFDWFVAIPLLPTGTYGPFYRVDGWHFWPEIGDPLREYSEVKCFYGIEKPSNQREAERLYKIRPGTTTDYCHTLRLNRFIPLQGAMVFVGAVNGGDGFQMNPNSVAVSVIQTLIVGGDLKRDELTK